MVVEMPRQLGQKSTCSALVNVVVVETSAAAGVVHLVAEICPAMEGYIPRTLTQETEPPARVNFGWEVPGKVAKSCPRLRRRH